MIFRTICPIIDPRGDEMPDYKEMYLTLFRATEQAIDTLIAAQQKCEEMYINAPEKDFIVLPGSQTTKEQ